MLLRQLKYHNNFEANQDSKFIQIIIIYIYIHEDNNSFMSLINNYTIAHLLTVCS